jgi:hypothetical protein
MSVTTVTRDFGNIDKEFRSELTSPSDDLHFLNALAIDIFRWSILNDIN